MSLYNTYNNEDIISRAVIAGMLGVLNNNIEYSQVWDNDNIEKVKVPWFYNQSGDERFMQDFYTHYASCDFPKPIDGNFDQIPRGVVTYASSTIDSARMTNRFVQGRYVKEIEGKLQSFVSFLYSIPLSFTLNCELWADTQITALKLEQEIREVFFKTVTFYVYYKGMRLGCTSGFSDAVSIDKLIEYSFETDSRIKLTFDLEVETYQPVFDPTTEMDANNTMKNLGYTLYAEGEKDPGVIKIKSPTENAVIPKGIPLMIEWDYTREGGMMNNVSAFWLIHNDNKLNTIELGIPNHQSWYWNIPNDFTSYKEPVIIWEEDSSINIYRKPTLSIIPEEVTNRINSQSFSVMNEGYFMAPSEDASMNIILEMKDDQNRSVYTGDNDIYLNIKNYKLDIENPVWVDPSANIIFPGTVERKVIDIHIANSTDNDAFGVVKNITIV